jgi:hypothetical protein
VTVGDGGPVSLLFFDGCPHWRVADERLRQALAQVGRPDTPIEYRTVTTPEQADELRFRGSPTVLVNGRDPFLDRDAPVGLSCRVYRTEDGLTGSPTVCQAPGLMEARFSRSDRCRGGGSVVMGELVLGRWNQPELAV